MKIFLRMAFGVPCAYYLCDDVKIFQGLVQGCGLAPNLLIIMFIFIVHFLRKNNEVKSRKAPMPKTKNFPH